MKSVKDTYNKYYYCENGYIVHVDTGDKEIIGTTGIEKAIEKIVDRYNKKGYIKC